jgi:NADH-quinone oxidoreductase subunit N
MKASDIIAVLPELILLVAALAILLVDPFLRPRIAAVVAGGAHGDTGTAGVEAADDAAAHETGTDRTAVVAISLTGFVASVVVALFLSRHGRVAFAGMLSLDYWAIFFVVLFGVTGLVVALMSGSYLESHRRHLGEYYALLIFAVIGLDLMVAARDFILFYVAFELMSISSYLMAAYFRYRVKSNESSLKYFLTGSFASAVMLYGISLVYGEAGSTNYHVIAQLLATRGPTLPALSTGAVLFPALLIGVGLAFKVSAAPFHMWTPDVYQVAPTPMTAFFSTGPKTGAFAVLITVFFLAFPAPALTHDWGIFFIVLSAITMLVGNVFALVQTNVKRMLAYSSIAHAGYLLGGLAAVGWSREVRAGMGMLIYLTAYTFMNLGAFAVLAYLKGQSPDKFNYSLKQFAGLGRRSPWAAVLLSLFMLSLTGIPGTAGFIGKFYVFGGMVQAGLVWLAVAGVVMSAVSAYYYLRVIIYMWFREPEEELHLRAPISGGMAAALALTAAATILIGIIPSRLWDAVVNAFTALFS